MSHIIRFFAFSLVIVFIVCQCARPPMTDAERSAIEEAVIATHAGMLSSASKADADGLFSYFIENDRGILAFDGALTLTREAALNGLRDAYSGLQEQKFEMAEEYVSVISPETAVLAGTGKFTSITKKGETFGSTFSVSIVFVLREGEWKVLHLHESVPNVSEEG